MIIRRICEDFFEDEEIDVNVDDDDLNVDANVYVMPMKYSSYEELKMDYTFAMIILFYCNAIEETEDEKNKRLYKLTTTLRKNLDKCTSILEYSGFYLLSDYNYEIKFGEFPIRNNNLRSGNKLWFMPILFGFNANFRKYSDIVIFKILISMVPQYIDSKYDASITQVQFFSTDENTTESSFNKRLYWHQMDIPHKGDSPKHINALYQRKIGKLLCGKDIYNDILKFIGFEITYDRILDDFKNKNKGKTLRVLSLPFRYVTVKQMQDFYDTYKLIMIPRDENYEIPYHYQYDYLNEKKTEYIIEYNKLHPDEKVIMLCMFEKRGTNLMIDFIFGYQHPILFKD